MKVFVALTVLAVLGVLIFFSFRYYLSANTKTQQPAQTTIPSPTPQSEVGLANPASVNCGKQGGQSVIMTKPDGSQYGICQFEDNQQCEEWALYRGECPVGGIKITGFDTEAQIFCAISGGETLAVADAKCTLPSGQVCSDEAFYNGTCPAN